MYTRSNSGVEPITTEDEPDWYVVRAKNKKEHFVAQFIEHRAELETFCPRISSIKKTRRGRVRYVEPMFTGYLFVRCIIARDHRYIDACNGVIGVLRVGNYFPRLGSDTIEDLKSRLNEKDIFEVEQERLKPGDTVTIIASSLLDFEAIVTAIDEPKKRVKLLLEFLGRMVEVTMGVDQIEKKLISSYDGKYGC